MINIALLLSVIFSLKYTYKGKQKIDDFTGSVKTTPFELSNTTSIIGKTNTLMSSNTINQDG